MKIAIVAPSPIPFGVGGAEKLWWGMLEFINKHTTHQCELIKIPTKENNFWDLIDSYYKFYTLDVSYFDMVISTKYPAWMVQHDNHQIYLQHCLRGLYDTYHFTKLPIDFDSSNEKIKAIINLINCNENLDVVFNALFELRNDLTIPDETYMFPGPFIRMILHYFDQKAMSKINKFSAISQTVINRKEYFPVNKFVDKVYHPSNLTDFSNKNYDFFFTASRLDGAKRIRMIVEAYLKSDSKIPLKIAGGGPLSEELKELVKYDSRIEMLGFVSDQDLMDYYSNAYAVIFVPYDEDYGLITIEAMMCEKPVLTFDDTGGVVEFVEDRVTGLICKPDINELSKNIDFISRNPELCKKIGKEAKKRVEKITWEYTIGRLLEEDYSKEKTSEKKEKITVVTTYPIYPPRGGGQNRIFYLYKEIAKNMIVDIVCLAHESESFRKIEIAPNLFEIRVPKTQSHAIKEWEIEKEAGIPITDIAMLYLYDDTPQLVDEIKKSAKDSKYVISSHPYTYTLLEKYVKVNLIHESHNVEYNLKKQMLRDTPHNRKLLEKLFEIEKKACLEAELTTVCAFDDAITFEKIYGFDKNKAITVANGVDLETVPYISKEKRIELKNKLGLSNQKTVLFIGSWHQPNIEAVEIIFNIAKKLPHYNFLVMGSVGGYFDSYEKPKNIGFTGITTDEEKELYLSITDIAINPMMTGSGTNLKMLDYMANGIPVISTEVGARGLDIPNGYIVTSNIENFEYYILNIEKYVNIEDSRKYVENKFSWKVISENLNEALK